MTVELRPVSVTEILDRSLDSVEHQMPNAGVKVERVYAGGVPNVLADEQLCERVFVNLISNAFQAMDGASNGNNKSGKSNSRILA